MDLIWVEGDLLVAGPDTVAYLDGGHAGGRYVGLRFAPGTGPTVLGLPAHELRDQRVPLDALWSSSAVRRLVERTADASDKGAILESVAVDRLRRSDPLDSVPAQIAVALQSGQSVGSIAEEVAFSQRQLRRRCLAAFGYGPKTLARILRMQQALHLARQRTPFAEVAAVAGYADQAHLARDVRALTGVPLSRLTALTG